jgi:hypothetical protein
MIDVGGATGNFLCGILERHSRPRGILFDLPHVVRDASALISGERTGGSHQFEADDFFESVPATAGA